LSICFRGKHAFRDTFVNEIFIFLTPHILTGTAVGTVLSLLFTGLIVQYINWEAPFYIMGSLAIIWCVPWCLLMTDSPRTNRFISEAERDYIISSVGECDESEEVGALLSFQAQHQ
jgi:MFS family permease